MDMLQIVLLGIIASVLYILLKDIHETFAYFIIIFTGIVIFLFVIQKIEMIFEMIETLANRANVDGIYLETILKIIGIAYITEFGANITRDAGLSSIAAKIELAGKIFILILAIPIITAVVEAILSFLPAT